MNNQHHTIQHPASSPRNQWMNEGREMQEPQQPMITTAMNTNHLMVPTNQPMNRGLMRNPHVYGYEHSNQAMVQIQAASMNVHSGEYLMQQQYVHGYGGQMGQHSSSQFMVPTNVHQASQQYQQPQQPFVGYDQQYNQMSSQQIVNIPTIRIHGPRESSIEQNYTSSNVPAIQMQQPNGQYVTEPTWEDYPTLPIRGLSHPSKNQHYQALASKQGLLPVDPKVANEMTLAFTVENKGVTHYPLCFQNLRHNRLDLCPKTHVRYEGAPIYKNYPTYPKSWNRIPRIPESFWKSPTQYLGYTVEQLQIAQRRLEEIEDPCVQIAMTYLPLYFLLKDTITVGEMMQFVDKRDRRGRYFGHPTGSYDAPRDPPRRRRNRPTSQSQSNTAGILLPSPQIEEIFAEDESSVVANQENKDTAPITSSLMASPYTSQSTDTELPVVQKENSEESSEKQQLEVKVSETPVETSRRKEFVHKRYRVAAWKKKRQQIQESASTKTGTCSDKVSLLETFEDVSSELFNEPSQKMRKKERLSRYKDKKKREKEEARLVRAAERARAERLAKFSGETAQTQASDALEPMNMATSNADVTNLVESSTISDMIEGTPAAALAKNQEESAGITAKSESSDVKDGKTVEDTDVTVDDIDVNVEDTDVLTDTKSEHVGTLSKAVADIILPLEHPQTTLVNAVAIPEAVRAFAVFIMNKTHKCNAKLSYSQAVKKMTVDSESSANDTVAIQLVDENPKSFESLGPSTTNAENKANSTTSADHIESVTTDSKMEPSLPKPACPRPHPWKKIGVYTPPEVMVVQKQKEEQRMSKIKGNEATSRCQSTASLGSESQESAVEQVADKKKLPVAGRKKTFFRKKIEKKE